jgi:L-fuculose-phosphate aldolase
MYEREFVVDTDGNLSLRLGPERFMFTPTGACLGRMVPEDMVITDGEGNPVSERQTQTAEWRLHMKAYRARPDVHAVAHGHCPWVLAATAAGVSLDRPVLPEVIHHQGTIPTAPYAMPSSRESAEAVVPYVAEHDAFALDRHGAVTLGSDLADVFGKMERVEQTARLIMRVEAVGSLRTLPDDEVQKIRS